MTSIFPRLEMENFFTFCSFGNRSPRIEKFRMIESEVKGLICEMERDDSIPEYAVAICRMMLMIHQVALHII